MDYIVRCEDIYKSFLMGKEAVQASGASRLTSGAVRWCA
jgi:hypothetical protein